MSKYQTINIQHYYYTRLHRGVHYHGSRFVNRQAKVVKNTPSTIPFKYSASLFYSFFVIFSEQLIRTLLCAAKRRV